MPETLLGALHILFNPYNYSLTWFSDEEIKTQVNNLLMVKQPFLKKNLKYYTIPWILCILICGQCPLHMNLGVFCPANFPYAYTVIIISLPVNSLKLLREEIVSFYLNIFSV